MKATMPLNYIYKLPGQTDGVTALLMARQLVRMAPTRREGSEHGSDTHMVWRRQRLNGLPCDHHEMGKDL